MEGEGEGESQKPQKWTAKEEEALLAGVVKHGAESGRSFSKIPCLALFSVTAPTATSRISGDDRLRSLGGTSTTVRTRGNYKPWRRSSVRAWGNYKPFRAAEALKEPQTISETNEAQRISKPADQDTESMLQLASQILERCSRR